MLSGHGTTERFRRAWLRGWAFCRSLNLPRTGPEARGACLHHDNHYWLFTAGGKVLPISRFTNVPGQDNWSPTFVRSVGTSPPVPSSVPVREVLAGTLKTWATLLVWNMKNRPEVRDFLKSRRDKVTPEQVGLPVYGARRVSGLRRHEVAALAGVSVEYYTRLERGNLHGVMMSSTASIAEP